MTRRFEVGPILVALAAIVLLVSLFLDWYGPLTAWDAFELADVLLAALAVAALVLAAGLLAPEIAVLDRRWLPAIVLVVALVVASQIIDPPPAAADPGPEVGAWIAFGAAALMLAGAVVSFGRVSFSVSVERRPPASRERVPVVDHRQDTTETGALPDDAPIWRRAGPAGEGDAPPDEGGTRPG